MAAKPKLSPQQWGKVRKKWEGDTRDGYSWLVEELDLPVSAPAVRKKALSEGWTKSPTAVDSSAHAKVSTNKVSKPSKVSKVSENHRETMIPTKTIPSDPVAKLGAFDQLTDMQQLFVREYTIDWNGTRAAIRAGYSERSAGAQAWDLLQKPEIRAAIDELMADRFERLGIDGDAVVQTWEAIATANPNELSQYRRTCCRHCWGKDFRYQYTPAEFKKAKISHEEKRAELLAKSSGKSDIGEFEGIDGDWFDKRKDPNHECPDCFGEGVGETFIQDTRKLSPAALAMFAGVKEGREGIEILTNSQEKARENLARVHGLFKDKEMEVNINLPAGDELAKLYEEKMAKSRARQATVLAERGLTDVVDVEPIPRDDD